MRFDDFDLLVQSNSLFLSAASHQKGPLQYLFHYIESSRAPKFLIHAGQPSSKSSTSSFSFFVIISWDGFFSCGQNPEAFFRGSRTAIKLNITFQFGCHKMVALFFLLSFSLSLSLSLTHSHTHPHTYTHPHNTLYLSQHSNKITHTLILSLSFSHTLAQCSLFLTHARSHTRTHALNAQIRLHTLSLTLTHSISNSFISS